MFKLALIIFNPSEQEAPKAVGLNSFWIDFMGYFWPRKSLSLGPSNTLVSPNLAVFFSESFGMRRLPSPERSHIILSHQTGRGKSSVLKSALKTIEDIYIIYIYICDRSQEGIPKKPIEKRPPWRGPLATRFVYNSELWSRWVVPYLVPQRTIVGINFQWELDRFIFF